jgi:hypothetical protein
VPGFQFGSEKRAAEVRIEIDGKTYCGRASQL